MQKKYQDINFNEKLAFKLIQVLDVLRSYFGPSERLRIFTIFTVLRRIDCLIGDHVVEMADRYPVVKAYPSEKKREELLKASHNDMFYNISGINFASILNHPDEIDSYLKSYLGGFNPEVLYILQMSDIHELIAKMNYSNCLYDVVNYYAGLDLGNNFSNIDICKCIWYINDQYDPYTTPNFYCILAKEILFKDNEKTAPVTIYDPVCGKGNLLTYAVLQAYSYFDPLNVLVYGQDYDYNSVIATAFYAMLLGSNPNNIKHGNTITEDKFENNKYDYIVADLPKGLTWEAYADVVYSEKKEGGRFSMGLPRKDSQLLFIQHIISKLAPQGRAIVFTDSAPLIGGDKNDSDIRKAIIEKDYLEAIIALPKTADFNYMQRYMLVLANTKSSSKKDTIHLIDLNLMKKIDGEKQIYDIDFINEVSNLYNSITPLPYHRFVHKEDLGVYKIYIKQHQSSNYFKNIVVDVPMTDDPTKYLKERNLYPNADNQLEILYDKTTDEYKIEFDKFFKYKEELPSSEETFKDVQESLKAIFDFKNEIESLPKLVEAGDIITVDNEFFSKIPSHWKGVYLSEVVEFVKGRKCKPAVDGRDVEAMPFLTIKDYRNPNIREEYVKDDKAVVVEETDIVLVSDGANSGEMVFGREGAIGPNLTRVKSKSDILNENYLYFLLRALNIPSFAKGVAIKHLNIKELGNIYVYLPPFGEQEKMETYLAKIELAIADVEEKFKVEIPVFKRFQDSIISEIVSGKFIF